MTNNQTTLLRSAEAGGFNQDYGTGGHNETPNQK